MAIFPGKKQPNPQATPPSPQTAQQTTQPPAQSAVPSPAVSAPKQPSPQSTRWRPNAEEQIEIEDMVYSMLAVGTLKSHIKKHLKKWAEKKQKEIASKQPGVVIQMDARTIERYLSRARGRFVEESGKTKEQLREESLNFYLAMARDMGADHRSRLQARERIDRLYGLDMPIKVAPTDPTGEQSYKQFTDQELDARILEVLVQNGAGEVAGTAGGAEPPASPEGSG